MDYIKVAGNYGIRFAPAQATSSGSIIRVCAQSAIWRKELGYCTVAYAPGDAALMNYRLGARQDDSHGTNFEGSGWWNADRYSNTAG